MPRVFPSSSKLRILIFNWRDLAHPQAGGAEVYTHRVAEEWLKMGHEVTLFCASIVGKPERETVNGLRIIRRGSKYSVYREAKKYYLKEAKGNFDLIIDEVNTRPFGVARWATDVNVVALIHQVCKEIWFYQFPFPLALVGRYLLEPYWLSHLRDVPTITVSNSSKVSLETYGLRKIYVVPEGFNFERFRIKFEKESVPTLVFLGRLSANKRPADAIRAFQHLQKSLPNAVLWVIGSGPEEKALRKTKLEGVFFLGSLSESEKFEKLSRAHALIVTSVREGWGLVVTEAAAMGTPTIAYRIPGLIDSVEASNGILSEPNPIDLSKLIKSYVSFWKENGNPEVRPSGVVKWEEVAKQILDVAIRELNP